MQLRNNTVYLALGAILLCVGVYLSSGFSVSSSDATPSVKSQLNEQSELKTKLDIEGALAKTAQADYSKEFTQSDTNSTSGLNQIDTTTETGIETGSSSKNRITDVSGLPLVKANVPKPQLAFGKNIEMTWEDFKNILQKFYTEGAPFRYSRTRTKAHFMGDWWVEHTGFSEDGHPLFKIIDLYGFSKESFNLTEEFYEYDLKELNNNDSYGEYAVDLENAIRDALYQFNSNIESLTCRQTKCLLKIRHEKDSNFNISTLSEKMKSLLLASNPESNCKVSWKVLKPHGNAIEVACQ